jgi:hypothetical protein
MSEAGSRAAWEDVTHSTPFTFTQVFLFQAVGIPIFQYTLLTYPIIELLTRVISNYHEFVYYN